MSFNHIRFISFFVLALLSQSFAFQIRNHHHPLYIQYIQERLQTQDVHTSSAMIEHEFFYDDHQNEALSLSSAENTIFVNADVTISTPVSYDEETGMVQTAVRAIVKHPIVTFVDHQLVGLSSTFVISMGAIHELADCLELEWAHHATSSTEGLAILSLGHALHYGRETIKQLIEFEEKTD